MKRMSKQVMSGMTVLGLVMVFGANARGSIPKSVSQPDLRAQLKEQIHEDIAKALFKNSTATSAEDWASSGYTPRDILENVLAQNSEGATEDACDSLKKLKDEDLALFQDELERPEIASKFACASALSKRLERYWDTARFALTRERMEENPDRAFLSGRNGAPLPSVEKHIDTVATPYLIRGDLKAGEIAFTFDDGPHATRTRKVLDILRDYGVRATFFEIGQNAAAMPSISKQVAEAGHTVAGHSWSHPLNMTRLSLSSAEREFEKGREAVAAATGLDIPFFRFPGGNKNSTLLNMLKEKQVASFYWTMDTRDWQIRNPQALYANVIKELDREKGGIILFHDVHEQSVAVLPHVLEELRARNFTTYVFVPH